MIPYQETKQRRKIQLSNTKRSQQKPYYIQTWPIYTKPRRILVEQQNYLLPLDLPIILTK